MATTEHNQVGPVDVSTAPWPHTPRKFGPWRIAALIAGGLAVAFQAGTGLVTTVQHFTYAPAAKASAPVSHKARASAKPAPAAPQYDLAGYRSVLNGADAQAFVSALGKLRRDVRRSDFTAEAMDTQTLITAASSWLAQLNATRPPPSYGANKLQYIVAAQMAAKAAMTIQHGMATVNLPMIQRGAGELAQARWLLARANAPTTQPTGS
jgi:hypothetical protein